MKTPQWKKELRKRNGRFPKRRMYPEKVKDPIYFRVHREVDGAIRLLLFHHPEYVADKYKREFHFSALKRLNGIITNLVKREIDRSLGNTPRESTRTEKTGDYKWQRFKLSTDFAEKSELNCRGGHS